MRKKIIIIFILICSIFIFLPSIPGSYSLTEVFRITEEPVAITRGTYGSVLTVNISFGDKEIEQWIQELDKPYPLLFVDSDWAERFPQTVRIIREKGIPIGLLGHNGQDYEVDAALLDNQIKKFEHLFNSKPLWFRTTDEIFPYTLHTLLWEVEVNPIASTFQWSGGDIPMKSPGEIISVPHHKKNRVNLLELERLNESREFLTLEDVLFGITSNVKKLPQ